MSIAITGSCAENYPARMHARLALHARLILNCGALGIRIRPLRADVARIAKAGIDPEQLKGKKRAHLSFNATF